MVKNSVLVVTYNRLEWLKKNLDSIYSQSKKFHNIYIVNNCSTDNTLKYILEQQTIHSNIIVVNSEKNLGGAGGFYLGLEKFMENFENEEWISIMDDDCILDDNFNLNILTKNSNVKNSYTPFRYNYEDKKIQKNFLKDLEKIDENNYERKCFPFNGFTINKHKIKEIGLPCKDYFIYGDDDEYCYRIIKANGKNIAVKNSIIYHPNKIDIKKRILFFNVKDGDFSSLRAYYGTRNVILNKKKYKKLIEISLIGILYSNVKKIIKYLLLGKIKLSYLVFWGICDGVFGKEINRGKI